MLSTVVSFLLCALIVGVCLFLVNELATWTPLHTAKRPRSFVIEKLDIAFRE